jgi:hypothetical protein
MEYLIPGQSDWISGTGSDLTGLVPGTYWVRAKAVQSPALSAHFHSEAANFIIHNYQSINFTPVYEGYTPGEPPTGNVSALSVADAINATLPLTNQITVVSVAALDPSSNFVLSGTGQNTTISPKAGLSPGIYTEPVTVERYSATSSGNVATITPNVTFKVNAWAEFASVSANGTDSAASDMLSVTFTHPIPGLAALDFILSGGSVSYDSARGGEFKDVYGTGLSYDIPIRIADKALNDGQKTSVTLTIPLNRPGLGGMIDAYGEQRTTSGITTITSAEATVRVPRSVDLTDNLAYTLPGYDTSFIQLRLLKDPYYPLPDLENTSELSVVPAGTSGLAGSANIDRVSRVDSSEDASWGGYSTYNIYLKDVTAGTVTIAFANYDVQHASELIYTLVKSSSGSVLGARDYFLQPDPSSTPQAAYITIPTVADSGAQGVVSVPAAPGSTKAPATDLITNVDGVSGATVQTVLLDGVVLDPSLWSVASGAQTDYTYNGGAPITLVQPLILKLAYGFTNTNGLHSLEVVCSPDNAYLYATLDVSGITDTYSVTMSQITGYNFDPKFINYSAHTPLSIDVINTGNQETGPLTVALVGSGSRIAPLALAFGTSDSLGTLADDLSVNASTDFILSSNTVPSIANGASVSSAFSVRPVTGLTRGNYATNLIVSGANGISADFDINFTVQNSAPLVVPGEETQSGNASLTQAYSADVSSWFTDADGDSLTYSIASTNATGSVNLNAATKTLSFMPNASDAGQIRTIVVHAYDGIDDSSGDVTITVTVDNTTVIYSVIKHFGNSDATSDVTAIIDYDHPEEFVRLIDNATGQTVDTRNYTVSGDGTRTLITLSEDYLSSLSVGSYSFTAEFSNGASEPITLNREAGAGGGDGSGSSGGSGGDNNGNNNSNKGGFPNTGDRLAVGILGIALALASGGVIVLIYALSRRKKKDKS